MKKIISFLLGTSFVLAGSFAQDFDFSDFGMENDSEKSVEIGGNVSSNIRFYEDEIEGGADAELDVKYSGNSADAQIKLNLNSSTILENPEDILKEAYLTAYFGNLKIDAGKMNIVWGKGDKLHILDNFNADDYTDFIIPDYLERRIATPMLRTSYGFNFSNNLLSNMKLEAVYTPFLPVDKFSSSGRWVPSQVENLTENVSSKAVLYLSERVQNLENARLEASTANALKTLGTDEANKKLSGIITQAVNDGKISIDATKVGELMATGKTQAEATNIVAAQTYSEYLEKNLSSANTAYILALNNVSALQNDSNFLYPNTNLLKYGQAGTRFTATIGSVDFGLSYYYGHYKQPSFNAIKFDSCIEKYLAGETLNDDDKFLAYDTKQTFGVEAATILWHFNLRGEAAYNLTEDVDGTNPWIHNNSVQWLCGFDIDLPFWNMNVNIQETGTYILKNDKITGSTYELYDVDYNKNGYSNNKIVANITSSFVNEKIAPEVTVLYGIENGDLVVLPKLTVKPTGDVSFIASGMYIWCRDDSSEFAAWNKNNFVQLCASINF